jgi:hypothetical protein
MGKKAIMISIDEFTHQKAKLKQLNISEICEKALIKVIDGGIIAPEENKECWICGSKENLIWTLPYEVWMCDKCNHGETRKILIGCATKGKQ